MAAADPYARPRTVVARSYGVVTRPGMRSVASKATLAATITQVLSAKKTLSNPRAVPSTCVAPMSASTPTSIAQMQVAPAAKGTTRGRFAIALPAIAPGTPPCKRTKHRDEGNRDCTRCHLRHECRDTTTAGSIERVCQPDARRCPDAAHTHCEPGRDHGDGARSCGAGAGAQRLPATYCIYALTCSAAYGA